MSLRKKTLNRWLLLAMVLTLLSGTGFVIVFSAFTLANYSDTAQELVDGIKMNRSAEIQKQLLRLNYFYDLSRKWKIDWLADRYLFQDSLFYEPAYSYSIRDWRKVIDDLEDNQDDSRSYMYGNARFREIQSLFQKKAIKLDQALNLVMGEVASDFEKSLRACADQMSYYQDCFDRVWNYDLATNKKDAEEALKNIGPRPKVVLGPIKDQGPPLIPDVNQKKPGGGSMGKEEGGEGGPRRRP